jgi:3-oxoacyl-[acyl-carrier protein] reductase
VTAPPLAGKVAIVTGASRGIGHAIATSLAESGASVVASARDADRLANACREIEARGAAVLAVAADVASREDADRLVDAARERFGRIDILVNNAGITRDGLLVRMKDSDWDDVMQVNLRGAFLMTRAVSRSMIRQKSGRVINVTSTAGAMGNAGQVNYSAAKAGDIGFTKALAQEGARAGITVNAICPGYVRTPLVEAQIPDQARTRGISEEDVVQQVLLAGQPTKQFVGLDEVAGLVLFLCSDAARSLTGAVLPIDGGWTAQ